MSTVSDEEVTRLMREIVAEKGESYVYPFEYHDDGEKVGCVYFARNHEGTQVPMCIVGHVMDRIGFHNPYEGESVEGQYDLDLSPRAMAGLAAAQKIQDDGGRWGLALARYLDELKYA